MDHPAVNFIPPEAAHWYRLSTGSGDARARLLLGNLYNSGQGVARNAVIASAL
jgi:TPR repeat protein